MADIPSGMHLLNDSFLNKGTAFTEEERERLGLRGLVPPRVHSMDEQVTCVLEDCRRKATDLDRHIYLTGLQDWNETLFYRVVTENIEEMMPIIYTPTVGQACQQCGQILRRPRGLFISAKDRGQVVSLLRNWPHEDVRIIVVTDGERVLGLGDLGANAMGIPVGKLVLYTCCAGIHPSHCLPITLDVGTDNEALLSDPLYAGMRQRRLRGEAYDDLVEEFVTGVQEVFPGALIQFEDFANVNAIRQLESYRDRVCTFNDDIQGTAAVALAGMYSALRITGGRLADQRVLFLGAGQAAAGIAGLLVTAMVDEGLSDEEARDRCCFVDSRGLVVRSRTDLAEHKLRYARDHAQLADFLSAVESLRPTVVIGVSGQPATFTRPVLEAMARVNDRPVVFALSNPTSNAECTAEEAYAWTQGRAIFAAGSPFGPVTLHGKTHVPGQGNNAYVFPGVGMGVMVCGARRVTDEMFFAAAKTLSQEVTDADLEQGRVYPPLTRIREVSVAIAAAVAEVAYNRGLATKPRPDDLLAYVRSQMYEAAYRPYA